jgi:hypothetical protein
MVASVSREDIDDDRDEDTEQAGEGQHEDDSSTKPGRLDGSTSRSVRRVCDQPIHRTACCSCYARRVGL